MYATTEARKPKYQLASVKTLSFQDLRIERIKGVIAIHVSKPWAEEKLATRQRLADTSTLNLKFVADNKYAADIMQLMITNQAI